MPRPRNSRREALAMIAAIKRTADAMRSRWTVGSTVFVSQPSETRTGPDGRTHTYSMCTNRQRTPEEYPENSAQEWKILWAYADSMEESAAKLKAMALEKWQAIEGTDHTLERVR